MPGQSSSAGRSSPKRSLARVNFAHALGSAPSNVSALSERSRQPGDQLNPHPAGFLIARKPTRSRQNSLIKKDIGKIRVTDTRFSRKPRNPMKTQALTVSNLQLKISSLRNLFRLEMVSTDCFQQLTPNSNRTLFRLERSSPALGLRRPTLQPQTSNLQNRLNGIANGPLASSTIAAASRRLDIAHGANAVFRSRASDFPALELHTGNSINSAYPRHWHDELYLCAILGGASELHSPGNSQSTQPGTLVLVPAGEIHADRKRDCSFRCMFLDVPAFQQTCEKFTEHKTGEIDFRTQLIRHPRTLSAFLQLYRALEAPASRLQRESALAVFFHQLVRQHSSSPLPALSSGNENAAVRRTRQFLDEHFAERISLQDLAQLAGLSPFHLHRSFCRKVGMPPHAYQVQARLTRALSMLRRGRSISDAASSTGFVDQSHFARHFKRTIGLTPGQYLAQQECTRRPSSRGLTSSAHPHFSGS